MRVILSGGNIYRDGALQRLDIAIEKGRIILISPQIDPSEGDVFLDVDGLAVFPGFIDVHTHLREPGFFYKESIKTGTAAAAKGGFTTVFSMPNLNPCPDTLSHLKEQTDIIDRDAIVRVFPYGTITKGEKGEDLSDMEDLAPFVCAFSDDGRGVQKGDVMERAMQKAAALGKVIVAHCEDNDLLRGGYIHDGAYARSHGHKGICSESEWGQIARDVLLAEKTGCAYHVCHVSTKESVEVIRQAKKRGVNVTCETAPHYLTLTEDDLKEDGRFKMNPPLREKADQESLIEGLKDGTIDMIATDHAPHSFEEKNKGLAGSAMGIVGLETAFPVLYTKLVKTKKMPLSTLVDALTKNPAKRFGLDSGIEVGAVADLTVFDLNKEYEIDPSGFLSKGKSTPFAGWKVFAKNIYTLKDGRIV